MIYNEAFPDIVEKSIINILNHIKNKKKKIIFLIQDSKTLTNLKINLENLISNNKYNNEIQIKFFKDKDSLLHNEYDIIIELPILSFVDFFSNRKFLNDKFNYSEKSQVFSFVNSTNSYDLYKFKLETLNNVKITNLASNYFYNLYLDKVIPIKEKLDDFINEKFDKDNLKEIHEKFPHLKCDQLLEYIKSNEHIKKKIFFEFMKKFTQETKENKDSAVSLTNGKKGYVNLMLIPPIKQREEYTYIF